MHLDDARIIDLFHGAEDREAVEHLATCGECRRLRSWWHDRIDDLRLLTEQTVDDAELHRLRTMFRQLGPRGAGLRTWIAELVAPPSLPVTAVRGPGAAEVVEVRGGPLRVLLQLTDAPEHALHGQVVDTEGGVAAGGGHVIAHGDGDVAHTAAIDEHGEFHLSGLRPGRYSVSWRVDDVHIHLDTLTVRDHVGE